MKSVGLFLDLRVGEHASVDCQHQENKEKADEFL